MAMLAFRCERCGHVFEELTTQEKAAAVTCEKCDGQVARHYQGSSLFGMLKQSGCGAMGDCSYAGAGCGCACRH